MGMDSEVGSEEQEKRIEHNEEMIQNEMRSN